MYTHYWTPPKRWSEMRMIWDPMRGRERGSGDMKNPLLKGGNWWSCRRIKTICGYWRKAYMFVYIFCTVLLCYAFFFLFFLRYSEHGWIYCVYFFLCVWCPAPRLLFYRKLHQAMGGFKLSFLVCFKHFSEEDRGVVADFSSSWVVHWSPFVQRSFLTFWFVSERAGKGGTQMKWLRKGKKCWAVGEFSSPSWLVGGYAAGSRVVISNSILWQSSFIIFSRESGVHKNIPPIFLEIFSFEDT